MASGWEDRREWLMGVTGPANDWLVERADPQPGETILELAAGTGDLGFAVAELRAEPRDIVRSRATAGNEAEQVLPLARDRQVETDPAPRRQRGRVDERTDRPVDPVGEDALEEREGVRSLDVELREGRDVEQGDAAPSGQVLSALDRRPQLRRPLVAPEPACVGGNERPVCLEPLWTLPPRADDELRAELLVPCEERRQPKLPRTSRLLARMDDVVDLAVLLLPPLEHVGRGRSGSRPPRQGRTRARRSPPTPRPVARNHRRASPTPPRTPRRRERLRTRRPRTRRPV